MIDKAALQRVREEGDLFELIAAIPYAKTLGMSCERFGDDMIFTLPPRDTNLGNPILPAIHGGVIGGFMEMSAGLYLMLQQDAPKLPRIVDFSIDFLRAGLNRSTFAECRLTRQGNRVANVTVWCWQKSRQEPTATARAHFIL
ncbi:PaaI family thioesterase [Hydrocarboniclastica marina]|uniref:PaaI family thioesterase n=1 Tax=Hydrocarboniclastica marina TaxID=2259620 RepID=A0A4P7XGK2_9ALTE|nr:PaaI family thioesterase [Hydrocarboniclastica marina]QCF25763.1 PaaI family thioesterase [Hydrocarboniclastica marina]